MKYLLEHEMAFDRECMGFPSIQGCHAIVYQTSLGLYGFHVAGNSGDGRWKRMAELFRDFIRPLAGLHHMNEGYRLYGSSFVGNNQRGYEGGQAMAKQKWLAELGTYAAQLRYTGKISGYDLFKSLGANASAYVEYRVAGEKCELYVRRWIPGEATPKTDNADRLTHKIKTGTADNPRLVDLARVVSNVDRNNLVRVHKEELR